MPQVDFLDYVISPMFSLLTQVLTGIDEYVKVIKLNRANYKGAFFFPFILSPLSFLVSISLSQWASSTCLLAMHSPLLSTTRIQVEQEMLSSGLLRTGVVT